MVIVGKLKENLFLSMEAGGIMLEFSMSGLMLTY